MNMFQVQSDDSRSHKDYTSVKNKEFMIPGAKKEVVQNNFDFNEYSDQIENDGNVKEDK